MLSAHSNEEDSSVAELAFFLVFSILLNGFGNGLTVCMNLGSALWTASAVNLSHTLHWSLLVVLLVEGVAVTGTNVLFLGRFQWRRVLGNLIYMFLFAYVVAFFADVLALTPITHWPLAVRVALDIFGLACIGVAISVYQRVNVIMHPNDDFMQIIRFKWLHGRAGVAQPVSFIPPIMISLLCFAVTRQLYAINIGTLFSLTCQGFVIGAADRLVFPKLKHRHLDV
ncbi:hypothetical protein ACFQ3L_11105 [Lacticaseibacillus jixianensis]|uniref:Sugar specific permease n=1 Tax=Lacticaseibacillus jixianensis TaxID=2486012 RepID=A0ABW4BAS3_9LACO|nr:hypothetical protein [Lacticaseibacillus jixianensis]